MTQKDFVVSADGHLLEPTDLFRTLLGAEPVMAAPYYVQFVVDGVEIGLDPHGHGTAGSGPVGYWHVGGARLVYRQHGHLPARRHRPPGRSLPRSGLTSGTVLRMLSGASFRLS